MKGLLSYYLIPFHQGFIFQIIHQANLVTEFLKEKGNFFNATNGWQIQLEVEPEINFSKKIVYLRGSDASKDTKVDRAYNIDDAKVNEVISSVNLALEELIKAVKDNSIKATPIRKNRPFYNYRVINNLKTNVYDPVADWLVALIRPANLTILD